MCALVNITSACTLRRDWSTSLSTSLLCTEPMELAPADEGYAQALDLAVDRLTERFAADLKALYERHRHLIPGWENRPLIIH